ncbi:MAG: glycosyltransferase family 9 protein [Candidatus Electryonea clarkiae]|nr:glycosyltransferase family 9 protein [Candidatus Electryonea clarkiae]MDP8285201.1 glycosyltransferase family 9 protein [Candidatus Electryonea clarkiae]
MRIGVIRFSSMGDIILTAPVLRGLRNAFTDAEIVFITTPLYSELAGLLPEVDKVEEIRKTESEFTGDAERLAAGSWDKLADLQASPRSRNLRRLLRANDLIIDSPPRLQRSLFVAARIKLDHFYPVPIRQLRSLAEWGVKDDGNGLELRISLADNSRLEKYRDILSRNPIVFVPGASYKTKKWPGKYWAELYHNLKGKRPVVTVGTKNDMPVELANAVENDKDFLNLTGQTSIAETASVISKASVVVSGDTGPMHMAVATNRPLVALFGPTVKEFGFYPFRATQVKILERNNWCRPCSAHGTNRCPLIHHRCLNDITPDEVAFAAKSFLNNQK